MTSISLRPSRLNPTAIPLDREYPEPPRPAPGTKPPNYWRAIGFSLSDPPPQRSSMDVMQR